MLGMLQARPLLGWPPLADCLELAEHNPPKEGDAGIRGREILLRAIVDDALAALGNVVLRVLQAEFVQA
jgi:hypothetical protein